MKGIQLMNQEFYKRVFMSKMIKILSIVLLLFCSCNSRYERNLIKMSKEVQCYLKDKAFKENQTINILDIKLFEYDTLNENFLDSIRILQNFTQFEDEKDLAEKYLELSSQAMKIAMLYAMTNGTNNELTKMYLGDAQEHLEKAEIHKDKVIELRAIDSTIRNRIQERISPKPIYRVKSFLKAEIKDLNTDKIKENILDTAYFFFNEDLKIIDIDNELSSIK